MIYLKYLWSLLRHKWFVFRAGLLCKVPVWRLIIHDWSKFTPVEFIRYAKYHVGGNKDKREWAIAWHHHLRLNSHHPEYWLLSWRGQPDFYAEVGDPVSRCIVVLPMPEADVREFVADCMGASKVYTGSWAMRDWLEENLPSMRLHPDTRRAVYNCLFHLGYDCYYFAGE